MDMVGMLTPQQKEKFDLDGLLVLQDFLSLEEVSSMKSECEKLVSDMNPEDHHPSIFSTTSHEQSDDSYFLESGDKIRFFFEKNSFGDKGQLKLAKDKCLNKIGHALHWHNPVFKKISFSQRMKNLSVSLGMVDPVIVQSMYIFKQPQIGTAVTPHQDGTFLMTKPFGLYGFWFPIDDATLENGCLWYVPGSHITHNPIQRFFVRKQLSKQGGPVKMIFVDQCDQECQTNPDDLDDLNWQAVPVKKGCVVLIHGRVLHKSECNKSVYPRQAYTFHLIETKDCEYSSGNWLQPSNELPFTKLFEN